MKTGPKPPYKLKSYSFLDRDYTFDEIKEFSKANLVSRAKITYKCKICGKIETIALDRFLAYNDVYCMLCNMKANNDYTEILKKRFEKQKETLKERYGVTNPWQCPNSSKKRNEATHSEESILKKKETISKHDENFRIETNRKRKETIIKKYGSLENFEKLKYEKYSKTCMKKYGVSNYRALCKRKIIKYDNLLFDSRWEFAFYLWHKLKNHIIKREPIKLEYEFNNKIKYCFPDFEVDGILYEIKGEQFFENGKMINPFNRKEDELYEAKRQCMLKNNVVFILEDDINEILKDLKKNNIDIENYFEKNY